MKKPQKKPPDIAPSTERKSRGRKRADASFPTPPTRLDLPENYAEMLKEIKHRIQTERIRVVMSANAAIVLLYWDIGRLILER